MSAGTVDIEVMRSSRTHAAIPGASIRSMAMHVPSTRKLRTGPSTSRLRTVNGSMTPVRLPVPRRPCSRAVMPGMSRLCWLWTAPFGYPVVPLV